MKVKLSKILILVLSLLQGTFILFSQANNTPPTSQKILEELNNIYGADQRLVSGKIYHQAPYGSVSGHPFCISDEWKEGQVTMDGRVYKNLLLKYDIVNNELVLNTLNLNNTSFQIRLEKGNISSFKLDNRKFVIYPSTENDDNPLFCELVSSGPVDFLLLRSKEMRITSSGGTDFEYKEYYNNYLDKDGKLVSFKSRKSLFRLFPGHRKELRKYISQQALVLGRKNTDDRALLVDYCNRIIGDQK